MKRIKIYWKVILMIATTALSSCNETEIVPKGNEGSDDGTRRELQLTLQNKLVLNDKATQTRANIATDDEQRINAMDIYVFGAVEQDGEYTYQEKFSYRADGTNVAGATNMEVINGDGSSARPTVLLRPKKGLYIKLFCVANQSELSVLNVADPGNPKYEPYTNFVPLIQTSPGSDNNTVTMGIPTEADFCKLLSRVIDPVNKADSIVPALPMVGSCTAPIDLHNFDLASRLYSGIRLVRTVARFDVVNDEATSKFTLQSVAMGNGRPATQLYPVQPQTAADGKLITYPVRDLTRMPQVNKNKQLPAFYAYGSPADDGAYLILKGIYRINATETKEVSYNVPFTQVVNGTGSRVEINPNHRYTIAITEADPYRVKFDFTVADWENGEDLGSFTPDNSFGTLNVEPADQFDAATKTMKTNLTPGSSFTITMGNNATPEVSLTYDQPGNEWLETSIVTAPVTRTEWVQNTTITIKAKEDNFTAYPTATLKLTNPADNTFSEMRIMANGVHLRGVEVTPENKNSATYDSNTQTLSFESYTQEKVATVMIKAPGAVTISGIPSWLDITGAPNIGYTISFKGTVNDYGAATVSFTNANTPNQKIDLKIESSLYAIIVGGIKWAKGNLDYSPSKGFFLAPTPDKTINDGTATRQIRGSLFRWMAPYPQNMQNPPSGATTTSQSWSLTTPTWSGSNLGNWDYYKTKTLDTNFNVTTMNINTLGDPCRGLGSNWRMPTFNDIYLLCYVANSATPSGTFNDNKRAHMKSLTSLNDMASITSYPTDDNFRWRGVYFTGSSKPNDNPAGPTEYSSFDSKKHLFLPAAGLAKQDEVSFAGVYGIYWTSSPINADTVNSWSILFSSSNLYPSWGDYRSNGLSIRCVTE